MAYPALWSRCFANTGRTGDQHDVFSIRSLAFARRPGRQPRAVPEFRPDADRAHAGRWRAGYWAFPASSARARSASREREVWLLSGGNFVALENCGAIATFVANFCRADFIGPRYSKL